jgi:HEAT repeat protein
MDLLQLIWVVSLVAAGAACAVMGLIILHRIALEVVEERRARTRAEVERVALRYLDGGIDEPTAEPALRSRSAKRALIDVALHLGELVRGSDLGRLARLLERSGSLTLLLDDLRHGPAHRRRLAAECLTIVPGPAVDRALALAMRDSDAAVRLSVALALVQRRTTGPLRPFLERLGGTGVERSGTLTRVLRGLAASRPDELMGLLAERPSVTMIPPVLDALGRTGRLELAAPIAGYTRHPNPDVRAAAYEALAALGVPVATEILGAGFEDEVWWVRAQAAAAAARLGTTAIVPALRRLLDDEVWWVRYRAATALASLGTAGRHALEAAAGSGDRAGRISQMLLAELAGSAA